MTMLTVLLICVVTATVSGDTQDFAVRLNNSIGNGLKEGRLEIYYSGRWGTVCDDGFTNVSARVACASLGFAYVGAVIGNRYEAGPDQIWLDGVNCTGTETGVEQCVHSPWGASNCSHSQDVSISCECGIRYFSELYGNISSPNFPLRYADNLACTNYISVPSGRTIIITFLVFATEPCCDYVMITCDTGNSVRSRNYMGFELPAVLTIVSCNRVNVFFRTDVSVTYTGFSLTYNITSDIIVGGFITQPSNAFPRSDKNDHVFFNCTTATKYTPWWTFNDAIYGDLITNSTCGVISSMYISSWFKTETTGPGSCNLIVVAPTACNNLYILTRSLVCTDSTLTTRRVILVPIDLELTSAIGVNSSKSSSDVVKDDEITISCTPSFMVCESSIPSAVFTYSQYSGSPIIAQMRILRTYWTSEGNIVSSTDTSNASSYVLVKVAHALIPRYSCNVVFDFSSNFEDISGDFPVEMSISTEPVEVLYWPTENNMTIIGDDNGHIKTPTLLYCKVAANPQATYTWINEINGKITYGPTLTVDHGGKYTCNASNVIRGQNYQVSKSVTLDVLVDDTNRLNITAIILGALLGAAVLIIIIILAILFCRKCHQQKQNEDADVRHRSHGNEHELRQKGEGSNRYEAGSGNGVDLDEAGYDNLSASRRPASDYYEALDNRK